MGTNWLFEQASEEELQAIKELSEVISRTYMAHGEQLVRDTYNIVMALLETVSNSKD